MHVALSSLFLPNTKVKEEKKQKRGKNSDRVKVKQIVEKVNIFKPEIPLPGQNDLVKVFSFDFNFPLTSGFELRHTSYQYVHKDVLRNGVDTTMQTLDHVERLCKKK